MTTADESVSRVVGTRSNLTREHSAIETRETYVYRWGAHATEGALTRKRGDRRSSRGSGEAVGLSATALNGTAPRERSRLGTRINKEDLEKAAKQVKRRAGVVRDTNVITVVL